MKRPLNDDTGDSFADFDCVGVAALVIDAIPSDYSQAEAEAERTVSKKKQKVESTMTAASRTTSPRKQTSRSCVMVEHKSPRGKTEYDLSENGQASSGENSTDSGVQPLLFDDSDGSDVKPSISHKPKAKAVSKRAWTGEEYVELFDSMVAKLGGPRNFEGAVNGRSGHQCYLSWRQIILGTCRKALLEKGQK